MKGFVGFPGGPVRFTAVPDLFWAELLPQIDDLAELEGDDALYLAAVPQGWPPALPEP